MRTASIAPPFTSSLTKWRLRFFKRMFGRSQRGPPDRACQVSRLGKRPLRLESCRSLVLGRGAVIDPECVETAFSLPSRFPVSRHTLRLARHGHLGRLYLTTLARQCPKKPVSNCFPYRRNCWGNVTVRLRCLSRLHRPRCEDTFRWRYCGHSSPRGAAKSRQHSRQQYEVGQDCLLVQ
jgi:hypothetical protein